MIARLAFFIALLLVILTVILSRPNRKEAITLTAPAGYSSAQKIEPPKEEAFVSALEYAIALSPSIEVAPAQEVKSPPKVRIAKRNTPKRRLAKSRIGKRKLVARW